MTRPLRFTALVLLSLVGAGAAAPEPPLSSLTLVGPPDARSSGRAATPATGPTCRTPRPAPSGTRRGAVALFGMHYRNRALRGPDLDHLRLDCAVVLESGEKSDPALYDDRSWITATWTEDGRAVAALLHHEYQANEHPGRCRGRALHGVLVQHASRRRPRRMAGAASRGEPARGGRRRRPSGRRSTRAGTGASSTRRTSWRTGRWRYLLASTTGWERPGSDQPGGVCLFRTDDPRRPGELAGLDGHRLHRRLPGSLPRARRGRRHLQAGSALSDPGRGRGAPPRHAAPSSRCSWPRRRRRFPNPASTGRARRDLITWDTPRLLLAGATLYDDPCGAPGGLIAYPSLLDPDAPGPQLRRCRGHGAPHLRRRLRTEGCTHHLRPRPRAPAGGDQGLALTGARRRDRSWNREEDPMTPHCLAWDDLPETRAPNGVAKRVLEGAGATLVRVLVPARRFAATRHSHPHEQFVQVISGSGTLETAQGRRRSARAACSTSRPKPGTRPSSTPRPCWWRRTSRA